MADRRVTHTRKDRDGDILALCNNGEKWSPQQKADAIVDIEEKKHTYYVQWPDEKRTEIHVVQGPTGKYSCGLIETRRRGTTSTTCPTVDELRIAIVAAHSNDDIREIANSGRLTRGVGLRQRWVSRTER